MEILTIVVYSPKFQNQIFFMWNIAQFHIFVRFIIKHNWLIIIIFIQWFQVPKFVIWSVKVILHHVWCIIIMKYSRTLFNLWLNVRKEQRFFRIIWNRRSQGVWNILPFCVKRSYVTFVGRLGILKGPLRNGFSFSENWSALNFPCKSNACSGNGLSRLDELCIVYAREFILFSVRLDIVLYKIAASLVQQRETK